MADLQKIEIDRDLLVLDELVDDETLPERNWESIIEVYNQNNKPFPISATKCAKIIEDIRIGRIPKTVFAQHGVSWTNFKNRFNRSKTIIEDIVSRGEITEIEWQQLNTLRRDPAFILGLDIDRVRAFHFNQATDILKDKSELNAQFWLTYMKEVHREEFEEKQDKKGVEVTINFGPGLLESI